jgi:hypothetical protein
MLQVKYHFLLFLCFSIVRGQIYDCKFVIKLFVELVFLFNSFFNSSNTTRWYRMCVRWWSTYVIDFGFYRHKNKFIGKCLVIPVGDKEYISPTNPCDLCRCESDQAFVCDSRCDLIFQTSNCTEAEMIDNNDPVCPCPVCPEQQGMLKITPCHHIQLSNF